MTVEEAFQLALQHHQASRVAEAETLYRQILAVQPQHAGALHYLGVLDHQAGRLDLAIQWIRCAIQLDPENALAHHNLGLVLKDRGNWDEAVVEFRQAISLQPDYADAHFNLGVAMLEQNRLDEAVSHYRRAIEIQPDRIDAYNNLGNALVVQGDLEAAQAAYRQALLLEPDNARIHSNIILALHLDPLVDGRAIAEEQARWNRHFSDPLKPSLTPHENDPDRERRLRIGYVSPDFRDHVVGRNLLPLFRHHDREQFEIVCYAEVPRTDAMTGEFRQFAHHWRETVDVPDDAVARMIREDRIDLLVDLAQHTGGNRLPLFAQQAAPVQLSFAGYPESSGVDAIPYRISDRRLEGEPQLQARTAARSHHETCDLLPASRIFLLDSFWCFDPCGTDIEVNELPAATCGAATFGGLNSFHKTNETLLDLWAQILGQVAGSRLVMICAEGQYRARTRQYFEGRGIAAQRIEFVLPRPRRFYLELYHQIDVMLDTFPYNGHSTSLDALWMGVPVVSLAGQSAVSRGGLSILSNIGLPELVARTGDEYVRLAVALASDRHRLAELRASLRARMENSVLMKATHFTRQIEAAYRAMWRQWCAQNPLAQ